MCPPLQVAVTRGTPIMSEKWITESWESREDSRAMAISLPLSEHKQKPFTGCVLALHGFQQEEEKEMKEIAVLNGEIYGWVCSWICASYICTCTYVRMCLNYVKVGYVY